MIRGAKKELHEARVDAAIELLEERGFPSYHAYSPLRRLFRKAGITFRPFYFLSKPQMAWLMGSYFVALGVIANIINGRPPERILTTAVLSAVIGYFMFRSYFGWRLKQFELPQWKNISVKGPSQPK